MYQKPTPESQRGPRPSPRVPEGRRRLEATETIRPSGGQARTGWDWPGAASQAPAQAWVRSGPPGGDSRLLGHVPGGQRPRPTPLSEAGQKKFIQIYERRKADQWKHPVIGHALSYARLIELEVRLLEKEWMNEGGLFARMRLR
jgi:hypothetical protein